MMTDKSERSLSPLGKDPLSIGKLFKSNRVQQLNPETSFNSQITKNQSGHIQSMQRSPKNIGINTSRTVLPTVQITTSYNGFENEMKPITHYKVRQETQKISRKNNKSQINRSFERTNQPYITKQNKNFHNNKVPNVVDFPSGYDDQTQRLPQTPDLPNRLASRTRNQNTKQQSPISIMKNIVLDKPETGIIKHQNQSRIFSNSAPKDFGGKSTQTQSFQISSPQLPHLNKIQNNVKGVRKLLNNSTNNHIGSSSQIYSNNSANLYQASKNLALNYSSNFNNSLPRKPLNKNIGQILKKHSDRSDPQQQQKLHKRKSFRISNINLQNSRMKLPTFKQQNVQQYQQQVDLDYPLLKNSGVNTRSPRAENSKRNKLNDKLSALNNSNYQHEQQPQFPPGTLFSNSFIRNTPEVHPDNILKIDLRTSLQKIKQAIIQGGEQMSVSFTIPQMFYHPPTTSSSSQQLHMLMLQIFSHVGINPQIVTIKKYINCVMMRQKKLCILWNFNGKIYFGGWKKDQTMAQGNKDGVGIQWVPSRYIYYGQFKDNKKQGYGVMKKSNKQMYIGCWKNNQRWGWGKVYDSQGNLHQNGQFIQGCFIFPKKNYNSNQFNEQNSKQQHFIN